MISSSNFSLDEVRESFKVLQPMGRVAEVKEMAQLIAFMISSQNSFMTGSVVVSDGGYTLKYRQRKGFKIKAQLYL